MSLEKPIKMSLGPTEEHLLEVKNLKKYYPVKEGILQRKKDEVRAVDGVSFTIPQGQTFGLVGESGSGKTTTGKAILHIDRPTSGEVLVDGQEISEMGSKRLRQFRKNMQIVYQDPTSSLNPRRKVGDIIKEPMKIHDIGSKSERVNRAKELLSTVGLTKEYYYRTPSALSGGQKQRVGIARAVILNPKFIVLDEPTSALDVSVQAQIVNLLEDIQEEYDLTYLFISHDLALVQNVSDWIGVMYLGRLVEVGPTKEVFKHPQHPYTRALLSSISTVRREDEKLKPSEIILEGEIPDPRNKPSGCAFRSRCPEEFEECANGEPPLYPVSTDSSHYARCLYHDEKYADTAPGWM